MADKQSLVQRWNPRLRNPMLKVESVVAFRECWFRRPSAWDLEGDAFGWSGELPVPRVPLRTGLSQPCVLGEAAWTLLCSDTPCSPLSPSGEGQGWILPPAKRNLGRSAPQSPGRTQHAERDPTKSQGPLNLCAQGLSTAQRWHPLCFLPQLLIPASLTPLGTVSIIFF